MKAIKVEKGYVVAFSVSGVTRVAFFNEKKKFKNIVFQERFNSLLEEGYQMYDTSEEEFKFPKLHEYHHVWGKGNYIKIGMRWRDGKHRLVEQHLCYTPKQKLNDRRSMFYRVYDNSTPLPARVIEKNYQFSLKFCDQEGITKEVLKENWVAHYISYRGTNEESIISAIKGIAEDLKNYK